MNYFPSQTMENIDSSTLCSGKNIFSESKNNRFDGGAAESKDVFLGTKCKEIDVADVPPSFCESISREDGEISELLHRKIKEFPKINVEKMVISYKNDEEYRTIFCKLFSNNGYFAFYTNNSPLLGIITESKNNLPSPTDADLFSNTLCSENCSISFLSTDTQNCFNSVDENEKDSLYFEEELIMKNIDYLFIKTKDNLLFQNLYDLAAAKMFSTDRMIGQCILLSYDYLEHFYECLYVFINSPKDFTEECLVYKKLVKIL